MLPNYSCSIINLWIQLANQTLVYLNLMATLVLMVTLLEDIISICIFIYARLCKCGIYINIMAMKDPFHFSRDSLSKIWQLQSFVDNLASTCHYYFHHISGSCRIFFMFDLVLDESSYISHNPQMWICTAEICFVWKMLVKMNLIMVIIIKHSQ